MNPFTTCNSSCVSFPTLEMNNVTFVTPSQPLFAPHPRRPFLLRM
nr:MAG TPA: Defensin-1, Scorpion, Centruroides limpidus limpidus [Caudoviricetes sp.]